MGTLHPKLLRLVTVAVCLAWLGSFVSLLAGGGYRVFLARNYWPLLVFGAAAFAVFAAAVALGGLPTAHFGSKLSLWVSAGICVLPLAYLAANPRPLPSSYTLRVRAGFDRLLNSRAALGLGGRRPTPLAPPATAPAAATSPSSAPTGATAQPTRLCDIVVRYPENVGRRVVSEGMVFRQEGLPAGCFVLFRFVITCCAADAIPAALLVAADRADAFPVDSWVRVRGRVERTAFRGLDIPLLRAEQVTPIPPPGNPYE